MKELYVSDLFKKIGQEITGEFFLRNKTLRVSEGKHTMIMDLTDRTGTISAKVWDEYYKEDYAGVDEVYVSIKGTVEMFKGDPYIKVFELQQLHDVHVSIKDYVTVMDGIEDLERQLLRLIDMVDSEFLRAVLEKIFMNSSFRKKFNVMQAGTVNHHDYIGGLLQHSVNVVETSLAYAKSHEQINPFDKRIDNDLLIAGGLLHDIGATEEFKPFPKNKRTVKGKLLGRVHIGATMVEAVCSQLKFGQGIEDDEMQMLLMHIMLTSRGGDEIVKPSTLEAEIIANMDRMDTCVAGAESFMEKNTIDRSSFTKKDDFFRKQYYVGGKTNG